MRRENYGFLILAVYILSTFIYAINLWFSISGFYILFATLIILFLIISKSQYLQAEDKVNRGTLAIVLLTFSSLSFANNVVDINGELSLAMWVNRIALMTICAFSVLYLVKKTKYRFLNFLVKRRFVIILAAFLFMQLTLIRIVKVPDIDVYQVLRYGPMQLVNLKNPYVTPATGGYGAQLNPNYHHYAYGPTTIYLFLPFDLIFGDPRYLLIVASFLTVFCLYKIAKISGHPREFSELISLIYLANPKLIYFLTASLTDVLIVSLIGLALLLYALGKTRRAAVLFALVLGVKIFYAIPFLFLLKSKDFRNLKFILIGLFTIVMIHLPFIVNNWQAMYKSIVTLNISVEYQVMLTRASLTFATLIDRQFHVFPPSESFSIAILSIVAAFWVIFKSNRNIVKILMMVSFVFMVTIFFGPIANANYYFTASILLLLAFAFYGRLRASDE